MLSWSFALLSAAVAGGALLVAGQLRFLGPQWRAALIHGAAGFAGFVCLLVAMKANALQGNLVNSALRLTVFAVALGLAMAVLRWRRRSPPGLLLFIHAIAGGFGYLLLAGFVF